jgi:hypothetical protein
MKNITKPLQETGKVVGIVDREEYFQVCYEHLSSGSVVAFPTKFCDLEEAVFHIESLKEIAPYYNSQRRYFLRHVIVTTEENRIDL